MKKALKIIISGTIAIPMSLVLFLATSTLHLKIYKKKYPLRDTEWEHNFYFDQQIELHFMVGVPIFYVISTLFILFLFNKYTKERNKNEEVLK